MRNFWNALFYVVMFLVIQLLSGMIAGTVLPLLIKNVSTVAILIVSSSLAGVITILLFTLLRWSPVSRNYVRSRPWAALVWCAVAGIGAIIPSMYVQELLPDLPNALEQEFAMIMSNRWGYVAIALVAPVAEELVFRGGVLRQLLRWSNRPWLMISLSAALFAAVHLNLAQLPHAFVIGLLLGWMYWRTGSVVPGVVYHWVNNTAAYVLFKFYPDPTLSLSDLFGGSTLHTLLAVLFSLFILFPALYQMNRLLKV